MKQILKELVYSVPMLANDEALAYMQAYTEMCTKRTALFAPDYTTEILLADHVPYCSPVKFSKPLASVQQAIGLQKNSQYREVLNCK